MGILAGACALDTYETASVDGHQVSSFSYEDCKKYIFSAVPVDTWKDARMNEVIEYLYSNKQLKLTERQRDSLRGLVPHFQ